ncbi:MAG: hypothetical protein EXS16_11610 [Gemmataceae bacterium]|nr:hypothetical protein [Gemmataceae bacterium]
MSNRLFSVLLCAAPFLLGFLSGCGGGPKFVPVKGVLTFRGTPVPNVILDFYPETGRPSWGQTDAEGQFALECDKENTGAVVGKHNVFARMGPGWEKIPGERPALSKNHAEFFEKFSAANSNVVVEIQATTKELNLAWD